MTRMTGWWLIPPGEMVMSVNLAQNIEETQQRIEAAAHRSGRRGHEINLVAVTKTVDSVTVKNAYNFGISDFGENRVQELIHKQADLPQARWHFIGRLQTNKVKSLVGRTCLIHSLDRWQLAYEIDKHARQMGISVPVLVQVNITGERSKTGFAVEEVQGLFDSLPELSNLEIKGLMTIAAEDVNPEKSRPVFRELSRLRSRLNYKSGANIDLKYLSMGMSQDFEVAIEEGANIVRIGSAMFK